MLSQHFSVIRRKQIFVRPVVSLFAAKRFGQAKGKKHSSLTDKGRNKIINEANNRVEKLCWHIWGIHSPDMPQQFPQLEGTLCSCFLFLK